MEVGIKIVLGSEVRMNWMIVRCTDHVLIASM
jgi:hypothetical protein